jgi:NAD(P)-dependent dehydrogenase (short-subunit alcohol dehydrogenase family)
LALTTMYKWIYSYKIKDPSSSYRPVVLVTGCSSGIGLAIAKRLVQYNRYRLVITTRNQSLEILKKLFPESENLMICALDVTKEAERKNCLQQVEVRFGGVDILICNAGISYRSVIEEMTDRDESLQMQTNYLGPMGLIRLCLPYMRKTGRGKIINISSVSGMLAMPTMASYSASKYALEGACEALWYEVKPFGINVSLVQPGFVRSDSYERVKYSKAAMKSRSGDTAYTQFYKSMEPFIAWLMRHAWATPESIAGLTLDVIRTQNPPLWIPASFDAEFFYYLRRIFPRRLLHPFLYASLPGVSQWGARHSQKRKTLWWPFSWIRSLFQK